MTYRLVLDIQTIQSLYFGERGIPRYTSELSRALLRRRAPIAALALNPMLPYPRLLNPDLARAPELTWNTARLFRELEQHDPIAYHLMSPFEGVHPAESVLPPHAVTPGVPLVCTVYDLIPVVLDMYDPGTALGRFYEHRIRILRHADLLLTLSECTRQDAIKHLGVDPDRTAVIGAGASEFFRPAAAGETVKRVTDALPEITKPFVLNVSGWEPRKNTETLIDAFALLPPHVRDAHQLVVTCKLPPLGRKIWTDRAERQGLRADQVVFTDYVNDSVLRSLYQHAALFVFPSLYEGFGLPVLEAARCGCPVLTSNVSSLPEVLEHPPATFDPLDPEGIARLLQRALTDQAFRTELHEVGAAAARRHTWDAVAERTQDAYASLAPQPPSRRRSRPFRIALVGPFPPARTGIATYNAQLAAELAQRCDLDCFAERAESKVERDTPYRVFPTDALGKVLNPASYDVIVYALGNSRFHNETFALAARYPGTVWLHDVDLLGAYLARAFEGPDADPHRQELAGALARYGERLPLAAAEVDSWAAYPLLSESGVWMSGETSRRARNVIVSSHVAEALVRLDVGPYLDAPPVHVLPLAVPEPRPRDRTPWDLGTPPLIVALGVFHPVKHPETIVNALATLSPELPARLVFVGDNGYPEETDRLLALARDRGIDGWVEFTGFVSRAAYWQWIERADVAVQLRAGTRGESSAAVMDALAARLPVLTNLPACTELPAGAVEVVPPDVDSDELAARLRLLLTDPEHRAALSAGAEQFASSWSFGHLADALVELVRTGSLT